MTVNEPLAQTALLAQQWALQHCIPDNGGVPGCGWYHGSWQILRAIGLFESIRSDDDFFMPVLAAEINAGARNILVSGAADYALLARIATASGVARPEVRVTVVDQCTTPLMLNEWYGRHNDIDVKTTRANILDLRASGQFDLVCTHSFMCFFDADGRRKLVRKWHDCLRGGGSVMTAQRARTQDIAPVIRYSLDEIEALAERACRLAAETGAGIELDPQQARELAEAYGKHHWTYLLRTPEEIRELFLAEGFRLESFDPPGGDAPVNDTPGTPNQGGSVRWRILARKEADIAMAQGLQ